MIGRPPGQLSTILCACQLPTVGPSSNRMTQLNKYDALIILLATTKVKLNR